MDKTYPLTEVTETQTVELVADQRLVIEYHHHSNVLNIVGSDEQISLSIHVTEDGPVMRIGGNTLTIQTEGSLSIDAKKVSIHSREGTSLTTSGNFEIQAAGDIHSNARIQTITANLGSVDIKANDDVKLKGERIRLNC